MQGVLPPPSVTTIKTDATEMLKKYYCFLPAFNDDVKVAPVANSTTPTKRVSFIQIPTESEPESTQDGVIKPLSKIDVSEKSMTRELDTSADKSIDLKMCSEIEAKETIWPEILKCRHFDVQ